MYQEQLVTVKIEQYTILKKVFYGELCHFLLYIIPQMRQFSFRMKELKSKKNMQILQQNYMDSYRKESYKKTCIDNFTCEL